MGRYPDQRLAEFFFTSPATPSNRSDCAVLIKFTGAPDYTSLPPSSTRFCRHALGTRQVSRVGACPGRRAPPSAAGRCSLALTLAFARNGANHGLARIGRASRNGRLSWKKDRADPGRGRTPDLRCRSQHDRPRRFRSPRNLGRTFFRPYVATRSFDSDGWRRGGCGFQDLAARTSAPRFRAKTNQVPSLRARSRAVTPVRQMATANTPLLLCRRFSSVWRSPFLEAGDAPPGSATPEKATSWE